MPVKVSFQPPPIRPDKNCDQTKRGNNVLAALHPDLHFQETRPPHTSWLELLVEIHHRIISRLTIRADRS